MCSANLQAESDGKPPPVLGNRPISGCIWGYRDSNSEGRKTGQLIAGCVYPFRHSPVCGGGRGATRPPPTYSLVSGSSGKLCTWHRRARRTSAANVRSPNKAVRCNAVAISVGTRTDIGTCSILPCIADLLRSNGLCATPLGSGCTASLGPAFTQPGSPKEAVS